MIQKAGGASVHLVSLRPRAMLQVEHGTAGMANDRMIRIFQVRTADLSEQSQEVCWA